MNTRQRSFLFVALLLLALLVGVPVTLAAILGNHRQDLSFTRTQAGQPAIAATGSRVGAVWVDSRTTAGIQGAIYFRGAEFDDSGGPFSFSQAKFVGNSAGTDSLSPDIASDPVTAANMHLVWKRNQPDPAAILYARCAVDGDVACDGVAAGLAEQTLVSAATGDGVNDPAIATTDNGASAGVHVVWQYDDANGSPPTQKIYYRGSSDGGATFNSENVVSGSDIGAMQPAIATDGAYVHVVWIEDNDGDERGEYVKYARGSTLTGGVVSGGWTVQPIFAATNPASDSPSYPDYPAVVAMSGTVMILWDVYDGVENNFDPNEPDHLKYYGYYALSTDNGDNFDPPAIIHPGSPRDSDENTGNNTNEVNTFNYSRRLQIEAAIAPDTAGNGAEAVIYAVWHQTYPDDLTNRYHDVYLAQYGVGSCEACGTWSAYAGAPSNETNGLKMENNLAYSVSPDVAVADGKIHLVYMEGDTAVEVDVDDVQWNVYYNNNFADITASANPGTFLPIILKNQ